MHNHFEKLLNAVHELDLVELLGDIEMGLWTRVKPGFFDPDGEWKGAKPAYSIPLRLGAREVVLTVTHIEIMRNQWEGELAGVIKEKIVELLEELKGPGQ